MGRAMSGGSLRSACNFLPVRVENGTARRFAGDGFVKDGRQILALLERSVEGTDGDYGPGGLDLGGGPDVPGEADAIAILDIIDVHGGGCLARWCCVDVIRV